MCLGLSSPTLSSLAGRRSGIGPPFSKSNTNYDGANSISSFCLFMSYVDVSMLWEHTIGARPAVHVRLAIVNISIAAKGGGFISHCSRRSIGPGAELVDVVMAWRRTAAVLILYLAVLELSSGKNCMYYSTVSKRTCPTGTPTCTQMHGEGGGGRGRIWWQWWVNFY